MGANGIQQANQLTIKKDYMSFFTKKTFSYEWILEQLFLQFIVINAYSCSST